MLCTAGVNKSFVIVAWLYRHLFLEKTDLNCWVRVWVLVNKQTWDRSAFSFYFMPGQKNACRVGCLSLCIPQGHFLNALGLSKKNTPRWCLGVQDIDIGHPSFHLTYASSPRYIIDTPRPCRWRCLSWELWAGCIPVSYYRI